MSFGKWNLATLSYLLETCFKEAMEAIKCVMREVMWNFVLILLWGLVKLFPSPTIWLCMQLHRQLCCHSRRSNSWGSTCGNDGEKVAQEYFTLLLLLKISVSWKDNFVPFWMTEGFSAKCFVSSDLFLVGVHVLGSSWEKKCNCLLFCS